MKKRLVNVFVKFLITSIAVSLLWGLILFFMPGPKFNGSPPRIHRIPRNNVDTSYHGNFLEKFAKGYRPIGSGPFDGPALWANPIVRIWTGWDILSEAVCLYGEVRSLEKRSGDGDFNIWLKLSRKDSFFSYNLDGEKSARFGDILVEIDEPIRKNFPIITDLAIGDSILVCGRWVWDRAHRITEIHPPYWLQILEES